MKVDDRNPHGTLPNTIGGEPSGRRIYTVYVVLFLALLAMPLVFMPVASNTSDAEKRELAPVPELLADGKLNWGFLEEAGHYFSDHFAFRNELIDLDATIKQRIFLTSSTNNVVVGTDGWLYYAGTLNDYQRKNTLSDHALRNAADNLALVQEYFTTHGKRFVLAVAPNKNGLYAEQMPYYELSGEGSSNLERLMPLLEERGISHVDLYAAFRAQEDVLYFQRDSHWTDQGALLAYQQIMTALGREPTEYDEKLRVDEHLGDVDVMLHPEYAMPEQQWSPIDSESFIITNGAEGVEDAYIVTQSSELVENASLIMYRDSFGNNLLPLFAATYKQAAFTKLVPYDMGSQMTSFASDVVIERAERHLSFFATDPPYMPAPRRANREPGSFRDGDTSVFVSQNGPYLVIEGTLDEAVARDGESIYVQLDYADGSVCTYEAFHVSQGIEQNADAEGTDEVAPTGHVSGDWGYRAYVAIDEDTAFGGHVQILVGDEHAVDLVASIDVQEN